MRAHSAPDSLCNMCKVSYVTLELPRRVDHPVDISLHTSKHSCGADMSDASRRAPVSHFHLIAKSTSCLRDFCTIHF
jgi:hypothetical protein